MLTNEQIKGSATAIEALAIENIQKAPGQGPLRVDQQIQLAQVAIRAVAGLLCNMNDIAEAARRHNVGAGQDHRL